MVVLGGWVGRVWGSWEGVGLSGGGYWICGGSGGGGRVWVGVGLGPR